MRHIPSRFHFFRLPIVLAVIRAAALLLILSACASSGLDSYATEASQVPASPAPRYPDVLFMVLSDTHLYDPALGTSGPAWDAYMAEDRKLLADSAETLSVALARIEAQKPAFVLVTGDLTKDGERICHEQFAAALDRLHAYGIKTYVLPGNHDINNPAAVRFCPTGRPNPHPTWGLGSSPASINHPGTATPCIGIRRA
jgi:hypothetical protein